MAAAADKPDEDVEADKADAEEGWGEEVEILSKREL
jgi:hypothetical protein